MDSVNYENKNLAHDAHSVGINEMHLQWCTKYRYEQLRKESHYIDCETAIQSAAKRHGIEIVELGVMPDHVHAIVILPPTMSPSKAIGLLKGASSYELFRAHPNFRKSTGRTLLEQGIFLQIGKWCDGRNSKKIRKRRQFATSKATLQLGIKTYPFRGR